MIDRDIDLGQYLPPFLLKFRELQALFHAEEPEFQTVMAESNRAMNNLFVDTADEEGVARREAIIGIKPASEDTLDDRKQTIISESYDNIPFTYRALVQRLKMAQGNDDVRVVYDDVDPYLLHISTFATTQAQKDRTDRIIETMIPANMSYSTANAVMCEGTVTLHYGIGLSYTDLYRHT